ncbi:PDR/VanB family oxidoreductase [Streptomyces sp. NBC_01754]|uniref:PDR/VanB family oxidoreductase n=1 Tax=Streptomyces sp. NBC_01754 TaxID=2975930 RepID=UPI002DDA00BE|nr:PDR/VanB family oxidoreductase [Streptomyces sp. NBC_01754]WSC96398.1 PDR/VanB family oxidoreductase [Streptomyces sp. NBC_01754]
MANGTEDRAVAGADTVGTGEGTAGAAEPDGLLEVVVRRRTPVADGVVSLELARIDGEPLPPFTAGSHVDLHLGPGLVRQYSLCGDPADLSAYRLGILRTADSRGGSLRVHSRVRPGQFLLMSPPKNNFAVDVTATRSVLFAGGIGITPLLAMARQLAAEGAEFEVHHRARDRGRFAFADELTALAGGNRVAWYADDDPETATAFDAEAIVRAAGGGAHVYVCGPRGFMDHVEDAARRAGVPEEAIHEENFANEVDHSGTPFTVVAARSGVKARVESGRTIAETLREQGVAVRTTCETGVCGTCLTRVVEGTPDHRDVFQSPARQRTNRDVALCCSRSRTPILVVDV